MSKDAIEAAREALQRIASQKMITESSREALADMDICGGLDLCIAEARAALAALPQPAPPGEERDALALAQDAWNARQDEVFGEYRPNGGSSEQNAFRAGFKAAWQARASLAAPQEIDEALLLERVEEEVKKILAAPQEPGWKDQVSKFADMILHGDDEHRGWLLEAAERFNAGEPFPAPRGKGTVPLPTPSTPTRQEDD